MVKLSTDGINERDSRRSRPTRGQQAQWEGLRHARRALRRSALVDLRDVTDRPQTPLFIQRRGVLRVAHAKKPSLLLARLTKVGLR
jgi:hypothetical protein